MRQVMVRYKLKADRVAENERYVKTVFEQLDRDRPSGVHYATFKLDDGVSFVHIASIDVVDNINPLTAMPVFKAFTAAIAERCEEPPVSAKLNEVGSYEFWASESRVGEH